MQTLIGLLIAAATFVPNAHAKPKPVLELLLVGHYSREFTQIFKAGKTWYCKTELRPYYESKIQPFDSDALKRMNKLMQPDRQISSDCRDKIFIIDRTAGYPREIAACRTDFPFETFVRQLARNCGR